MGEMARRARVGPSTQVAREDPACTSPAPSFKDSDVVQLERLRGPEPLEALAALTARFAGSYVRFMGGRGDLLGYPRLRVLEVLEATGPTIMRSLAEQLGMTARNVTSIVDALEEAGLVERLPHPSDRRATVVRLTAKGALEGDRGRRAWLERAASAFGELSLEEQQAFAALLARLVARLCHERRG
jgi:DNA-binding MarR family transcriptional regulator